MSDTDSMLAYNLPPRTDVLARAFVAKGDLSAARQEYERLTRFDRRSKDRRLIHPEYHRRLAEIYEQTGDRAGAEEQMRRYRDLWKAA
jgi:hypothetical protein